MKPVIILNLLLGFLLVGSPAVADDTHNLASGNQTPGKQDRRVSAAPLHPSATEAASATASNSSASSGVSTNALPPLPAGVTELKFSEFFRQPIEPPRIAILRLTVGTKLVLTSTATSNLVVQPEYTTNLTSTNWYAMTVQTNRVVNGALETLCGRPEGKSIFIRIRVAR